ncbi:MAG: hypothetical protein ACC628_13720, partial [Pirellulaceae bacterium]
SVEPCLLRRRASRNMTAMHAYLPRDFVETAEGLFFAVLASDLDKQRLPGFLRYVRTGNSLRKLATEEANQLLESSYPEYLYYSSLRDVRLHGVPPNRIRRHHSARRRANEILRSNVHQSIETKTRRIIELLVHSGVDAGQIGLSGSLAIGAHHAHSDIDLVIYDRRLFVRAREAVRHATAAGDLQPMNERLWREAYERRRCCLSFSEFLWHERRKHNKLVIDGTKADISLVIPDAAPSTVAWKKIAKTEIQARVIHDLHAFDYPASWSVDHAELSEVVSFTHTYTGQARRGELITARGWKERSATGASRLLVGTSREARDEFIKVV